MKKKNVYKLVIVAFVFLFVLPSMTLAQSFERQQADTTTSDYEISYTLTFSPDDISFETINGYDTIRLADCASSMKVGKPMLPVKHLRLALPGDMQATNVQILDIQREQLPGEYHLFPSQTPQQVSALTTQDAALVMDQKVYTSNQVYPEEVVVLTGQTDFAGQAIAVLEVYPMHYQPREKTISLVTSVTFANMEMMGISAVIISLYLFLLRNMNNMRP